MKSDLSVEYLRDVMDYSPETGEFMWKRHRLAHYVGVPIHGMNGHGYRHVKIKQRIYILHRLAWFYVYGQWPKHGIDHINRDRSDNRICNLREATIAENSANRRITKHNTSGFKNVMRDSERDSWLVRIKLHGQLHSRRFKTVEEAAAAVESLRRQFQGEFATDGSTRPS